MGSGFFQPSNQMLSCLHACLPAHVQPHETCSRTTPLRTSPQAGGRGPEGEGLRALRHPRLLLGYGYCHAGGWLASRGERAFISVRVL